jgi:hypothetical protein
MCSFTNSRVVFGNIRVNIDLLIFRKVNEYLDVIHQDMAEWFTEVSKQLDKIS